MSCQSADILAYSRSFGTATDPRKYSLSFERLLTTAREFCAVVQGILMHVVEVWRYGLQPSPERKRSADWIQFNSRAAALPAIPAVCLDKST